MNIKAAHPGDIPLIRELCFQIWPQTYRPILSEEQIDYMLDRMYSAASLQEQMSRGDLFFILYDETTPIGFASIGPINCAAYKLHKIYVLPSQQGKGAGRFLLGAMIEKVRELKAEVLQLNVNRHNKARSFYERLGFSIIKEEDIDIGNGYFMNDYVMELRVKSKELRVES